MSRILPLRTGWDPSGAGGGDEYPSDLPPEWRLSYFANAFWGVLVPPNRWRGVEEDEARTWVADTPGRFRFFLDLGAEDAADLPAWHCSVLGERLGGLVGSTGAMADPGPVRLLRIPPDRAGLEPPEGFGPAWEVPPALVRDLRGARAWVEARVAARAAGAQGPAVALLGGCGLEDLAHWQTLLELMGLA